MVCSAAVMGRTSLGIALSFCFLLSKLNLMLRLTEVMFEGLFSFQKLNYQSDGNKEKQYWAKLMFGSV